MQGAWVWSLVGELRSHMFQSSQASIQWLWDRVVWSLRVTSRESVHHERACMMLRSSHVPAAKLQHSQVNKQINIFWKKNFKNDEWHDWDKEVFLVYKREYKFGGFFFFLLFKLKYSWFTILVSGIQYSDSVFFSLYSIKCYYKIMAIIPCAIQ